jgi:hypothetical protein
MTFFGSGNVRQKKMSIYATLWTLKFPKEGDEYIGCDWIEVTAQGVPSHIGSPTPGMGYEDGELAASYLKADGLAPLGMKPRVRELNAAAGDQYVHDEWFNLREHLPGQAEIINDLQSPTVFFGSFFPHE